jgi:spermidine synthase
MARRTPRAKTATTRTAADASPRGEAPPLPGFLAGALVFLASGAVLVLEILAVRMLAPYVGVTLETYSAIIGVVLAGIACGTWGGGRLADRLDPRTTLGPVLVAGGLLAIATLPLVSGLGEVALASPGAGAILLLAVLGFFLPAAVLSAVTPTVVKLQLSSLRETGAVVGRLSALGTAGALVGTFATGFVLVSRLATTPIVVALGAALVAGGIALGVVLLGGRSRGERPGGGRRGRRGTGAAAALLAAVALSATAFAAGDRCQVASAYYCARVEHDPGHPTGRVLRLDVLQHSYVDLADPARLEFDYTRLIGDAIAVFRPPRAAVDALHLGGGGFTLPRHLAARRPGSRSTVLELDPALVELARARLALRTGPDLRVRTGDARTALRDQPSARFDLVIGDAFGGLAVPWHLTTIEVAREVRRVLRPGGLYALNVIDFPPNDFARAEARTLAEAFEHVALLAPPEAIRGVSGGNFILLASDRPLPLGAVRARIIARGTGEAAAGGRAAWRFYAGAPVLRDEYAPVDQLLTPTPARAG